MNESKLKMENNDSTQSNEEANISSEEIQQITERQIEQIEMALLQDKPDFIQSDPTNPTPYEAYMNFINLVKKSFPEQKIAQIIASRQPDGTLEDALPPSFVYSLAYNELMKALHKN